MPTGVYERTAEHRAKMSAKQYEHLKRLREDPEIQAKRIAAKKAAHEKKSGVRKWMEKTGCNYDQYWRAYVRWTKNKSHTGFTLEQEIARAMERPDGKVVVGQTYKKNRQAIQHNGEVPVLDGVGTRRKRRLPPTPDASAVPPPIEQCWTDFPDDTAWVDELD